MTLIAFNVKPSHVDIVTDTLTYDANGRTLGRGSKVHLLAHLDAAMLSQGSGDLGNAWSYALSSFTEDADFDGLDALAQTLLPGVWEQVVVTQARISDSIVFHLGYSREHGQFKAYAYPSITGFQRTDVTDRLYVMPAPTSEDPTEPRMVKDWVTLAKRIRHERALAPITSGLKVFIGGDVVHTRLKVGEITQRKIHTFDDTGEEFCQMVAGTLHPLGQLGPCPCGSDTPMIDCHGLPPDGPCNCSSGKIFGECCRVSPGSAGRSVGALRSAAS